MNPIRSHALALVCAALAAAAQSASAQPVLLNEIYSNPPGNTLPHEYIELKGAPLAPLDGYFLLAVHGNPGIVGRADLVLNLNGVLLGANAHLGNFVIGANHSLGIDQVTTCDGADICPLALPGFPQGVMIVHDGENDGSVSTRNTNFKLAPWQNIAGSFSPALAVTPFSYDPRRPGNRLPADFTYTTNNGSITIRTYECSGGAVIIPSTINGLPVTTIGDGVFQECTSVTSVTIPNSVTTIGNYAFSYCTSLASVTIPDSVTSIGDNVFEDCRSLTSIGLPNKITAIGQDAFEGCTSLTSVMIPDSVITIGGDAFQSCTSLTNVTIGNTVTSIGDYAFEGCTSLTSVAIPNSVITIMDAAFSRCTSLTSVTIGNGVSSIGVAAFYGCTSLSAITVDALNSSFSSVDGVLFGTSLTTLIRYPEGKAGGYVIPNSVTSVGDGAFLNCTRLTMVTIGNGVTSIGDYAFEGCNSLTSIAIPNSVITIMNSAFSRCTSLTSVTIGNGVRSIGSGAFYGCTSLMGVYFQGNAPAFSLPTDLFFVANNVTVYYLPGTTGWGLSLSGRPTALWVLPNPLILNNGPRFGVQNNRFGFIISWATNLSVVVEASTGLAQPLWSPVGTNTLTGGSSYFSDPEWTNYPARFYRLRSP